ncbi:HAMP domain-containing histidine kinase [Candidatus Daviesbacteria bacterium]|nr:HAMP domain-containing histidine kinase [Candidatus Daviesbacteria bacterium]
MNEFTKARVKLTGWYILISLLMLAVFTFAAITAERRAFNSIERALGNPVQRPRLTTLLENSLARFHGDFQQRLFIFDIVLLFGAAYASWLLSGRTLKPIQDMVEAQTEFAADASHELRTPLTTIGMEIEALERTQKVPKGTKNTLDSIKQEVLRMRGLVDGLLTLVRSEDQKAQFRMVNLNKLITECVEKMKHLAKQKGVILRSEATKALVIQGNEDQLKQVIIILLDNAIKYTPKGGKVEITLLPTTNYSLLTISDTGAGIAEADLLHVFDRFYRASGQKQKGAGLGLAIAKKIIESHKGEIAVKSKLGSGSTFIIHLPLT